MFEAEYTPVIKNIWTTFGKEVKGFHELSKQTLYGRITYESGPWEIVLDSFSSAKHNIEADGEFLSHDYTRVVVAFPNKQGFTCEVYNASFVSEISKLFGMQDIEIGEQNFDENYIIKGNDEAKAVRLFRLEAVRDLIRDLPHMHLFISSKINSTSLLHPNAKNELCIEIHEVISEIDTLRKIKKLTALLLSGLAKFDNE